MQLLCTTAVEHKQRTTTLHHRRLTINRDEEGDLTLLASMLGTVSTFLDCRRPAFFKCTVTIPTVRVAGHDLDVDHLVRAAGNKTWA